MSALPPKADIKSRSSHKPVHPQAEWAEHVCSASQLNVNLFGNRQGIIYVNAEVSNGTLDLAVTK